MDRVLLVTSSPSYSEALQRGLRADYTAEVRALEEFDPASIGKKTTVVLDAHAEAPRGACDAVRWVRAAREQDIGTPFLILTWLPYRRAIVNRQLASNPFIGYYYHDSCRFLQLPVLPERLAEVLDEVGLCTNEDIALGKRFLADIGHAHHPSAT